MAEEKIHYPYPDGAVRVPDPELQCKRCEEVFPASSLHDCSARVIRADEMVVKIPGAEMVMLTLPREVVEMNDPPGWRGMAEAHEVMERSATAGVLFALADALEAAQPSGEASQ